MEMAYGFFFGKVGIMVVGLGERPKRINEYLEEMKKAKSWAVESTLKLHMLGKHL